MSVFCDLRGACEKALRYLSFHHPLLLGLLLFAGLPMLILLALACFGLLAAASALFFVG